MGKPKSDGSLSLTSFHVSPASSLRITSQCFCMNSTSGRDGVGGREGPPATRLPLLARPVRAEPRELLPAPPAVRRAEERRVLDTGVHGVRVVERRLEVPDTRELPRMLRAVVPLMSARHAVVRELVAGRLPRLAAVVRPLDDLSEPTARLRRVQPVRIGRRRVDVIDLPPRKQRAVDVPPVAGPVRRQDKGALPGAHEQPHSTHLSSLSRPRFSSFAATNGHVRSRQSRATNARACPDLFTG